MPPPPRTNQPPPLRRVSASPSCQKCTGLMLFTEKKGMTCYGLQETVDNITRQQLKELHSEAQKKGGGGIRGSVTFGQSVWTPDMEKANQAPFCAKGIHVIVPDSAEKANGRVQQNINQRQQEQMQKNGRKKKFNAESRKLNDDLSRVQKQRQDLIEKLSNMNDPNAIRIETEKLREVEKALHDIQYKRATLVTEVALKDSTPSSGPRSRHSDIVDSSTSYDNKNAKSGNSNTNGDNKLLQPEPFYSKMFLPLRDVGLLPKNEWDLKKEADKSPKGRTNTNKKESEAAAFSIDKKQFEKSYESMKKNGKAIWTRAADEIPAIRKKLADPATYERMSELSAKGVEKISNNFTKLVERVRSETEKRTKG